MKDTNPKLWLDIFLHMHTLVAITRIQTIKGTCNGVVVLISLPIALVFI